MATKEEEHSTRGRANLLRALLDGRLPPERESEDRVLQELDLCLGCKACKAECPSRVDMARLKSDFQHRYYRDRRRPLSDLLFGAPDAATAEEEAAEAEARRDAWRGMEA